ncbi:hypothetical protein KFL_004530120 [Klebsormidium nitens]|uniref:Uncharacterized protein n=1 Tax=Klebsormidium nitens TaxID=105231 RepID=A0A1Y1IJ73_KLENI|nr:hypothetical protein KFL_004530120 [Klebsormidium nitens]|eukprot:GAQ88707.1 hypothetical protein KFL_004530120 [Klebsormidium nitens]
MSRVRNLGVEEFAGEIAKELECDLYTRFIIEDAISGRVFLAEGEKGDALIEDFKDLKSGAAIKRGHKTILKELRDSWLASEGSRGGKTETTRESGGGKGSVELQRSGKHLDARNLAGTSSQEVNVSRGENDSQDRPQNRSAPSSPLSAAKLFKTLWHSKKFTIYVGKHGVRRLQSFHARVVSRAAADLGLTDYMPDEAKAKQVPSEDELMMLRSINLKRNPKDLEWRDKIFDSILDEDEHSGEVVGLDGTVYKWPKACNNSTFTAIIDDLKKKFLHADRYRKSQAKELERYHERKPKKVDKKRAEAGEDGAMQEQPRQFNGTGPSKEPDSESLDESQPARPGSGNHPNEALTPETAPSKLPKPKTSCSLEGCSSTERPPSFCQACLDPVHEECVQELLKRLYGVEKYDGELLYCANHHSNFGFRQGLGGKCALPACAMAGKPAQHRCEVCKDPVHNLCFQGFLHEVYGVEGYDQGRFACKEHASALGFQKATSGHHQLIFHTQASAKIRAEGLISAASQPAGPPVSVPSESVRSPPRGSDAPDAGKGSDEREKTGEGEDSEGRETKAGEAKEKPDKTKNGARKRKGSQTVEQDKKKKIRPEGISPTNEKPNEPAESEVPGPKTLKAPPSEPVEEIQVVRQSNRAPKVNRLIHNDSFVVNSKQRAAAGTESGQKSREKVKIGATKKPNAPPSDESEESMSLSGSAIETSEEEDSDAESPSDLPIGGAFEDKDEKLHPSILTSKALRKGIDKLKLLGISKSPKLKEFSQNYLLKLFSEGLIAKKKVTIKNRKWREDGTSLDPADIRMRF